ncbi:hypothetical protein WCLP8_2810002 [uncultured Gammaproteobacteria bacterium]
MRTDFGPVNEDLSRRAVAPTEGERVKCAASTAARSRSLTVSALHTTSVVARVRVRQPIQHRFGVFLLAVAVTEVAMTKTNTGGLIQARSVEQRNGEIILSGDEAGVVQVSGTLDASGKQAGQKGGSVKVLGEKVRLTASARVDVSGSAGGGEALIGGAFRGGQATPQEYAEYTILPSRKPPVPNAIETTVEAGAIIAADAIDAGQGGKIVVWSDGSTSAFGTFSARGGLNGGDGGFVETSGHYLSLDGAVVSTAAFTGKAGNWLLDPYDLTVIGAGTPSITVSTAGGVFNSVSGGSTILNTQLQTALGSNNVTLTTSGSAGSDGNIIVDAPVSWAGTRKLTLNAYNSIKINAAVTSTGTGGLTLTPNIGAMGGVLVTGTNGSVSMTGGTPGVLTIGGHVYTLINDLTGLQSLPLTGYYALNRNIDASDTSNWNAGHGFVPIGYSSASTTNASIPDTTLTGVNATPTSFTGSFDGLGHAISGLTISNTAANNLGLFSWVGSGSAVQNISLIGGSVTGGGSGFGGYGMLAGTNMGRIGNAVATGTVSGGDGALSAASIHRPTPRPVTPISAQPRSRVD